MDPRAMGGERRRTMKSLVRWMIGGAFGRQVAAACVLASTLSFVVAVQPAASAGPAVTTFDSAQAAVDALVAAAEKYDLAALQALFGPDGDRIVQSGEPARDRENATKFAAKAREK